MKATPYAYLIIRHFEGLRLSAYRCPSGILTIGYGHTSGVKPDDTITQAQANDLLEHDVQEVEACLNRLQLNINQNQFDALTSFIFNIGQTAFTSSTMLKLIKANPDNPEIEKQFKRWVHSSGQILPGLQRRRQEEARLYFLKP